MLSYRNMPSLVSKIIRPAGSRGRKLVFLILSLFLARGLCDAGDEALFHPYDEVTARGGTFYCRVQGMDPDGLRAEPAYAKGSVTVPYGDLENVISRRPFHVVFGEEQRVRGRLLGIESGELLVGDDRESARRVALWAVEAAVPVAAYDESWLTRTRVDYRYWTANLNFGWKLEEDAVNKHKLEVGLNLERRQRPSRYLFDIRYAFETEQVGDSPHLTTKDELVGYLTAEYDLSDRFYSFVRPAGEWDTPRGIDLRIYPAGGVGYRLVEKEGKQTRLNFPLGLGYVYENFVDIDTNEYVSVYLGADGRYDFGNGIVLGADVLYMLGLEDPSDNWLFRLDINLTVPVVEPVAVRLRFTQVNDNNPSPEIGNNKLTTGLAMAVTF